MDRNTKEQWVSSLKHLVKESPLIVVTHYNGLTVAEMTDLRGKMRAAGASFKVTKNRLTRLALDGTSIQELSGLFNGPTAIAYSSDPVAAAKVTVNFAKENEKLVVLGGAYDGQILDVDAVTTLAKLPSLDELRAKLVAFINTPATRIAGILKAPSGQIARVISAHAANKEAA